MRTNVAATPSRGWRERASDQLPLAALVALLAVAALLPRAVQDQAYHGFADQRSWFGIPRAADVLSNLPFALVGILGIVRLVAREGARFCRETQRALWCIAIGLVGTAAGSAWYHFEPSDASLVWDRLPLIVVFAGVLGAALAQRFDGYPAKGGLPVLALFGIASVVYWSQSGNLAPYLAFQAGGILALLCIIAVTRNNHDPFPWGWVIAWYALAKIAETGDRAIWDATGGLIAGHAIKHFFAAMACAAALWPLLVRRSRTVQD